MPSSTTFPPNDLDSPATVMAGTLLMIILVSTPGLAGELTCSAQRVTMGYPLVVQQRDPLLQEVGEGGHLQQRRPPLDRGTRHHGQALAGQVAELPVLGDVEPPGLRRRQVKADPVHPLARRPGTADRVRGLQRFHRAGDRAAAGQQRLGQLTNALLWRIADRQVPKQAAHHRRIGVAPRVEAPHVVGKSDLCIGRHEAKVHT